MDRSTGHLARNISAECTQPLLRFPEVATLTWTRLQPLTSTVQQDLQRLCAPVLQRVHPYFHQATQWTDTQLADLPPWQVAVLAIASTWLALTLYRWVSNVVADIRDVGECHVHKQCSFAIGDVRFVPHVLPATLWCWLVLSYVMWLLASTYSTAHSRHCNSAVLPCRCASDITQHSEGSANSEWLCETRSGQSLGMQALSPCLTPF